MGNDKYIQNIEEGSFKNSFTPYVCHSCGLIPEYTLVQKPNGTELNISFKNWTVINESKRYCVKCSRGIKIKKIVKKEK